MAGGAGYLYSFSVGGQEASFKNLEMSGSNQGNDTTSRLNPDGTTNDGGAADRDRDISTFTITLTEMARGNGDTRGDISTLGFGFIEGDRDDSTTFEGAFDGVAIVDGTGLYCMQNDYTGSVPGEGRGVIRFQVIGDYNRYS